MVTIQGIRNGHQILRIREAGLHVPTFQVRKEHKGKNGTQFLVKVKATPSGTPPPPGGGRQVTNEENHCKGINL